MSEHWWQQGWVRNVAGYLLAALLAVGVFFRIMDLAHADLSLPFAYDGDALFTQVQVRSVLEHGWYFHNPQIGAPFGSELYDFPLPETLHFGILKLLGLVGCNYVVATNLYYLLTFPLTTLAAYFVLRHFGRGRLVALVAALLYTFLPYHIMRSIHNLFLAAYYLVPLMVMVILWVYREPGLMFTRQAGTGPLRFRPFSWRVLGAIAVCAAVASAGVYYAFFGCFFLVVAGLVRALAMRRFQPLVSAAFFTGLILAVGVLNLAPNLLYTRAHGANPTVQRHFKHAEMFALRVTQLVLPVHAHRVGPLEKLRARYDSEELTYEINNAELGLVGSAGFLLLLARLFHRRNLTAEREQEQGLVLLNGAGLLLATAGGFGCLIALTVSPSIRAYTRICVFLAFFALFALALVYEQICARYGRHVLTRWALRGGLLLVLVLGLYDQISPDICFIRRQGSCVRPQVENDVAFVRAIEARLPAGAMVFQLPQILYPETGSTGKLIDYDHFRVYLQSRSLRWSYGAMKGRPASLWQATVAAMPQDQMVRTLVDAGFSGIYFDRDAFADDGQKLEADLRQLLAAAPLQSGDGKMLFFDLTAYGQSQALARAPRN
jgi:phosphoglycerol transferase